VYWEHGPHVIIFRLQYSLDQTDGSCRTHGEVRNIYTILVGRLKGIDHSEDNMRMDLREIG
jgi:hypothetical protein